MTPPMSRSHFHPALRVIHWAMAGLILGMLFVGVAMVSTAGPAYLQLQALHRPLGLALLGLAVVRMIVRLATGAPALPDELPRWQALAARLSHLGLYGLMMMMPLVGWAMLSAGGYPVQPWAGWILPPIVPRDLELHGLLRQAHRMLAFAFLALVLAHLTAALFHGLVRRDGVLASMTWGRP